MATDNPTSNGRPVTLTDRDVRGLCDRLLARGSSLVFRDQPEITSDMILAGRLLRRLVKALESVHLISDTTVIHMVD